MSAPIVLMNAAALRLAVSRMAHEIAERNPGSCRLLLLGVQKGGVHLASRLALEIRRLTGQPTPFGQLDASLHRDDLDRRPAPDIRPTNLPGDPNGATVVLADDVLFSGRTARAALDALHHYGRPERVQLAVLIDRRGHRELPIQADYAARKLDTRPGQRVDVHWAEDGREDAVLLLAP